MSFPVHHTQIALSGGPITMANMHKTLLLALTTCVVAACASAPEVQTHFAAGNDFARYRTFSFMPQQALLVGAAAPVNPALEGHLKRAASNVLTRQGYTAAAPQEADFILSFTLGARDGIRENSFPSAYRRAWIEQQTYATDTRDYTESTLAIDIFDVKSRKPVWHGRASSAITMADRMDPEPLVNTVVSAILAEFPPD